MTSSADMQVTHHHPNRGSTDALLRSFVIGLTAFLTVVDLFATQAILPSLAKAYQVSPAAIGFAVNASTIGMAAWATVCAEASDGAPNANARHAAGTNLIMRLNMDFSFGLSRTQCA